MTASLGATTFTSVTWTAGDYITETKLDNMVANEQAYDSHAAQGLLLNNDKSFAAKDSGGTNRNVAKIDTNDILQIGDTAGITELGLNRRTKFSAYLSSNEAISSGVQETLVFDTEEYDVGADYNNSTGEFTAPIAGYYMFTAASRFLVAADQDALDIVLEKNGSDHKGIAFRAAHIGQEGVFISAMIKLAASDTVSVAVTNNTNDDTIQSGQAQTWFQGWLDSVGD